MKTKSKNSPYFMYKDKPLVRCGNTLYYGYMSDKYVIKMVIHENEKSLDLNVSKSITVELISSDMNNRRILKTSEKNNLYSAIDIGYVWLNRALEE